MQLPTPLVNLLDHAKTVSQKGGERLFQLEATIITPTEHIDVVFPKHYTKMCLYSANHSDDVRISGDLQPGVYYNNVLPYKDNLKIQIREISSAGQRVKIWTCVPLITSNPTEQGSSTQFGDMNAFNDTSLISFHFQLIDPGYAKLKNKLCGGNHLVSTLYDALTSTLIETSSIVSDLPAPDNFKGVDIDPNLYSDKRYRQVAIPQNVKLTSLVNFLQNDTHYGLYNKGAGSYYRKGMWYVFPLFGLGRYEKAKRTLDVYRIPQDAAPTLPETYYVNGPSLTVLGLGLGEHKDTKDVERQNTGIGERIVLSDSVTGDTGYHYSNGSAITTRGDSVAEFKTASRADGNELIPLNLNPTSNVCKPMSEAASKNGDIVHVQWHNSDSSLLFPGMPVKYYYMKGQEVVMKEGTLLGDKTEYKTDNNGSNPIYREHTTLQLFVINKENKV